jgi:pyruvate, water dikinase
MDDASHRTARTRPDRLVRSLDQISKDDVEVVGGKGANLGEMFREGLPVPEAFVITTEAYSSFLRSSANQEKIEKLLRGIDVDNPRKLESNASSVRTMIESSPIPRDVARKISESYGHLLRGMKGISSVAVRSSATTEDLKEASFAGQQSSFLNVRSEKELLSAIRKCWASAFTPRAIFYRAKKGFALAMPLTAVVVQRQIASEKAGVGFCVHPVSGDRGVVVIEGSWGQGEEIVSGRVTPDMFVLEKETGRVLESKVADKKRMKVPSLDSGGLEEFNVPRTMRRKPSLEDGELKQLWSLSRRLEEHYSYPQDFEWAIDGGKVFLLQTRAVTVLRVSAAQAKGTRKPELRGLPASPGMATGPVKLAMTVGALEGVNKGDVLVTRMTTPDFVPAMMKTAAIVTDEGGMTSHAAIVSREIGVPCVVGTGDATKILKEGAIVTVDGSNGLVFAGRLPKAPAAATKPDGLEDVARLETRTKVYMNLGVPEKISDYANLPFDGIGLMRLEFVIASYIREHPLHMLDTGREAEFVSKLAEAIATVAKAISPRPVVVRFSDFKTNEYKELKGGEKYEEAEPNPIIGWRGVSRYISPQYEKAFRMELKAMRMAREDMKLKNVWAMLPFVRTTWEVKKCLNIIEEEGLVRDDTFKLWFMAEVPSTVFLAREFAEFCDGFSIGSNDLTPLILGIDRDSSRLGNLGYFDERNGAVKEAIRMLVEGAHEKGKTVSICGQAPSVYPDFAEYLMRLGIDSVSVNPDVVAKTRKLVHELERKLLPTARAARVP